MSTDDFLKYYLNLPSGARASTTLRQRKLGVRLIFIAFWRECGFSIFYYLDLHVLFFWGVCRSHKVCDTWTEISL